jgi:hypothetical protein
VLLAPKIIEEEHSTGRIGTFFLTGDWFMFIYC